MEELFLVAHRVRGKVAYDIAQRLHLSNGRPLWLIPTSCHRAYPLRWMKLDESFAVECSAEELASVPDHYDYLKERKQQRGLRGLIARVLARLRRPKPSVMDALAHLLESSLRPPST